MLDIENTKVLSWMRKTEDGQRVVVAVNFTADPQTVNLLSAAHAKTLLKSPNGADPVSLDQVALGPFGVYIGEVQ